MLIIFIPLVLICSVVALSYLAGKYNESYWRKRGVKLHTKHKFLGITWDFLTQPRAGFEIFSDIYKLYPNEPAVGIGNFLIPTLYVKDPGNINHILHADFQSFNHRALESTEKDLLADNLLFMHGSRWKLMRQQMTPLFTAMKMKNMYYIIDKSAKDFIEHLKNSPDELNGDVYDTLNTFCCAAIGAAVFGISAESIFDAPFLYMAKNALSSSPAQNFKFAILGFSKSLANALGITLFKEYEDFFIGAIKQVIRQREKENVKRYDFADICIGLQRNGTMKDQETGLELEPTDELLAAQAFFFFLAGVDPTASAMYGTLIEVGRNPDALEKVHKEIDETFEKHNGELTYDVVNEMGYLDKVLSEALRMYPPIGVLNRQCVQDTVLPVGNIRIQKGSRIFVAVFDLHHDPNIYPNPEVFDPERFSQDLKGFDSNYLPFGKGRRNCIGLRYARLQAKTGIIHVLRNFTVKTSVEGRMKYSKQPVQVRPINAKVEVIPRKFKGC